MKIQSVFIPHPVHEEYDYEKALKHLKELDFRKEIITQSDSLKTSVLTVHDFELCDQYHKLYAFEFELEDNEVWDIEVDSESENVLLRISTINPKTRRVTYTRGAWIYNQENKH